MLVGFLFFPAGEGGVMPRLSVPLTIDQHAAIRRKAGALGVPQAEVARRLLLAWVRGEVEMPIGETDSEPFYDWLPRTEHGDLM